MLGHMLSYIRKAKKLTKAKIAEDSNINTGHLTHIEKGERNPSHKVLKSLCKTMNIPYSQLMYTYDKEFTEEHKNYELESRIGYDKILAVDILDGFIDCPTYASGANIAVKMTDDTMEPRIRKGEYAIVEFNSPLNSRDIGLFFYNNKFYIRKFIARKDSVALRSENRLDIPDITIDLKDKFYIIGKVVGVYNEKK